VKVYWNNLEMTTWKGEKRNCTCDGRVGKAVGRAFSQLYFFKSSRNQQEIIYLNCSSFSCTCVNVTKPVTITVSKPMRISSYEVVLRICTLEVHVFFGDVQVGKDRIDALGPDPR